MAATQPSLLPPPGGGPLSVDPLASAVACGPALTVVFEDRARRRAQRRAVAGRAGPGAPDAGDAGLAGVLDRLEPAPGTLAATVYAAPEVPAELALGVDEAWIPAEPVVTVAGDPSGQGRDVAASVVRFRVSPGPAARLAAGGPATLRAGGPGPAAVSVSLPPELCRRLAAECEPAPG